MATRKAATTEGKRTTTPKATTPKATTTKATTTKATTPKATTTKTKTTAESKLEQVQKSFLEVGIELRKAEDNKLVATINEAESWDKIFKTPAEATKWLNGYKGFVEAQKLFAIQGFELYRKEKYLAINFVDKEQIFKNHLDAIKWLNTEWLQQVEESNNGTVDDEEVLKTGTEAIQQEPEKVEEKEEEIIITPIIPVEEEDIQAVTSEERDKARALFLDVTIEQAMKADVKPVDTDLDKDSYTWEEIRQLLDNQATSVHQLAIAAARKGYGLHFEDGRYTLKV